MNYIDVLLVLVVLLSLWNGWQRGFILGILELAAWIGSVVTGFLLYPHVVAFMERHNMSLGMWTLPFAFIAVIIIVRVIFSTIVYRILRSVPQDVHTNFVNRLFGIFPGLVNGMIWAALIATLLLVLPVSADLTAKSQDSRIAGRLTSKVQWAEEKIAPVFNDVVKRSLTKLTVEPGSETSVKLPYTVKNGRVRIDLEMKMLEMVNNERMKRGIPLLRADPELAIVARQHSADMFTRGYFSHVTPEGQDPFDRMKTAGIRFLAAGENLALAPTLATAHDGLMHSPGHRANILNPSFGRLGIGILDGGIRGIMVTQEFRN